MAHRKKETIHQETANLLPIINITEDSYLKRSSITPHYKAEAKRPSNATSDNKHDPVYYNTFGELNVYIAEESGFQEPSALVLPTVNRSFLHLEISFRSRSMFRRSRQQTSNSSGHFPQRVLPPRDMRRVGHYGIHFSDSVLVWAWPD